jgi:hypothetical protein
MLTRAAWAGPALLACALAAAAAIVPQDSAKEKLKTTLKDNDVVGEWIYDDIHGAFSQARKSGRPILAVIRCVPSWNYREIDKQVARRETPGMAELLDKFVCVRIVQAHGLDLATFQFDTDLTWAVFFLNADKVVYGRYGHRGRQKEPHKDVSIEAFKKAARAALELHEGYPKNKKELAGKTGASPEWRLPELIPDLKTRPEIKASDGKNCVRCHTVHEGELWSMRAPKQTLPDRMIWPYPMPEAVGLTLDPKEMASVTSVEADTPAEKAGFKAGDRIARLDGQPILSIADVQWVLNNVRDGVPVKVEAEVERDGKNTELTMTLPPAWRQKSDPTWRHNFPDLKHRLIGVDTFEAIALDVRKEHNLPPAGMALRVKKLGGGGEGRNTSFTWKTGDVLINVDGKNTFDAEHELIAHLLRKNPAQKVDFTIIRDGRIQKGTLVLP